MTKTVAAILWKHLFTAGHDACRLMQTSEGFRLEGHTSFDHEGAPCSLRYAVDCDGGWQTGFARVSGFLGGETVEMEIERTADGVWLLNGAVQDAARGQRDLDLGFTPATNLIALRRFALEVGEETAAPAAYLLFPELKLPELKLTTMDQSYRRLDRDRYDYVGANYHQILSVSDVGFVTEYPSLWTGRLWLPGQRTNNNPV